MGTILIVVLVLLLLGALPTSPYGGSSDLPIQLRTRIAHHESFWPPPAESNHDAVSCFSLESVSMQHFVWVARLDLGHSGAMFPATCPHWRPNNILITVTTQQASSCRQQRTGSGVDGVNLTAKEAAKVQLSFPALPLSLSRGICFMARGPMTTTPPTDQQWHFRERIESQCVRGSDLENRRGDRIQKPDAARH